MTCITCRLNAKNRDQLRNPTLGNQVCAAFTFFYLSDGFIVEFLVCRIVFGIFWPLNLIYWLEGSSAAVPILTLLTLLGLFGLSIPLTFIGAFVGYRKPV